VGCLSALMAEPSCAQSQQEYPQQLKKTLDHLEKVCIGRAAGQLLQPLQTVIVDGELRERARRE
jgi:DeoR/GlpR family transcriptional regulator of sugar metabolism